MKDLWTAVIALPRLVFAMGIGVDGKIHVMRNEEIELPIAIEIAEGGAGGPLVVLDAGLFGDVRESAVAVVAV